MGIETAVLKKGMKEVAKNGMKGSSVISPLHLQSASSELIIQIRLVGLTLFPVQIIAGLPLQLQHCHNIYFPLCSAASSRSSFATLPLTHDYSISQRLGCQGCVAAPRIHLPMKRSSLPKTHFMMAAWGLSKSSASPTHSKSCPTCLP